MIQQRHKKYIYIYIYIYKKDTNHIKDTNHKNTTLIIYFLSNLVQSEPFQSF